MFDKILERFNVKYEDLNPEEQETLNTWVNALQKGSLSIEKIRDYVARMREAVENDLAQAELGKNQDLFLKARLRNYMLLEGFLSSPEKAKKQLEQAVSGLAKNASS